MNRNLWTLQAGKAHQNHFSGLKICQRIQSFTSLRPCSRAVLAVLTLLPGVHVFQRVRPLYGQLGRVHHGQGALVRVQPRLVLGGVLLLPRRVFLTRLVHTPHHLEGAARESEIIPEASQWRSHLRSQRSCSYETKHFCRIRTQLDHYIPSVWVIKLCVLGVYGMKWSAVWIILEFKMSHCDYMALLIKGLIIKRRKATSHENQRTSSSASFV